MKATIDRIHEQVLLMKKNINKAEREQEEKDEEQEEEKPGR